MVRGHMVVHVHHYSSSDVIFNSPFIQLTFSILFLKIPDSVHAISIPSQYSELPLLASKSFQLGQLFIKASRHKQYQNKWYGDNIWRKIIEQNHNSGPITKTRNKRCIA